MMKQPRTLLNERNVQFLRGLEDGLVVVAPHGTGDVFDAGAGGAVDVVDEGELGIWMG